MAATRALRRVASIQPRRCGLPGVPGTPDDPSVTRYSAIVLAGGAGRRMAARGPKPAVPVGGVPMVARVLAAVEAARPRVVVGPGTLAGLLPADVIVTLESPPGGGPRRRRRSTMPF